MDKSLLGPTSAPQISIQAKYRYNSKKWKSKSMILLPNWSYLNFGVGLVIQTINGNRFQ